MVGLGFGVVVSSDGEGGVGVVVGGMRKKIIFKTRINFLFTCFPFACF